MPSRKWMAARVVALGALATAYFEAGAWSPTLSIMATGIAVAAGTAYLLPNSDDGGE